jgi:hypothetical protein
MAIDFGTWTEETLLGEQLYVAELTARSFSEDSINDELKYCGNDKKARYQKTAEAFLKQVGGAGRNNNALFGTPIDRSKANTDRMHAITLSMGADTGKRNSEAHHYNAAIVPIYALQNPDGTYVLPSGGRTNDPEKARVYTDRSEAESHRLSKQTIVEI